MNLTSREIMRALDRLEPTVAEAFREAMRSIQANANIGQLEEAIRAADIQAAIRAAGVRDSAFVALTESTRAVYVQAGVLHAQATPARVDFGFNVNNPRAESWIRENGAELVRVMKGEQEEVIRSAIREATEAGISRGANPRRTALDLAGRINKATGRRVGGQIALSSNQATYVRKAAEELRSGSKTLMNNYLNRKLRDRRFDGIVRRAMEAGKGLSESDVARLTGRYSDRLLQQRAEMIARTETNRAFQKAADESLRQLVEEGHVQRDQIRRIWDATMDMNTRPTHAAANGQVVGLDEPFNVGGYSLMYPLDPSAPASETVACRCFVRQDINYITERAANG